MSIEAHNYVIKLKVGNLTAKFVLGRLADRADERFSCYPSVGLLAAEVEKSERTVQRALEFLVELRLVSDRPAYRADGSQTSNRYFLHGPWDDFAGTGLPFPEIVTPKEARSSVWAQAPAEAEFRPGSAAAAALKADAESLEASRAAAEAAAARAEAAKDAQRQRGRKAAAAKPYRATNGQAASISAAQYGVTYMSPSPLTCMSPPGASPMSPLEPSVAAHSSNDAPSGRSPVGGRSPSTSGSSRARVEGGFAASGKTSSPSTPKTDTRGTVAGKAKSGSKKAAHSREQLDTVRRVRAFFPPELLDHGLPDLPVLSDAILTAMGEGRTAEQMRDRIWFRWANHGFKDIWAEEKAFDSPVGVAVALVRPLRRGDRFACPDLRCENGVSLDTKEVCRLCVERLADWRAERARRRSQEAPVGANSARAGTGSAEAALPPQRAAQPREPFVEDSAEAEADGALPEGLAWWEVEAARYQPADAEDRAAEDRAAERSPAPF
ncbi:helix-turn-helix domain-containing protein [Streptomyces sp. NPDC018055]|uniref:helix-turn-helix domain-containing protein n=1 Tax=Streptomyces sp. NPDC018055 TaxID=3365038 RepID=UPI003790E920